MPIPGFTLIAPPEFITANEAVERVQERFKSSACTEAEARGWLTDQVRHGKLKLRWVDANPEFLAGLYLDREGFIFVPGFPEARRAG